MGGASGSGGEVYIAATTGSVSIAGTIEASSGLDGGYVAIDAIQNITSTADAIIDAHAGAGGFCDSIDITSDSGGVSLGGDVNLSAGGDAINGSGTGGDFTSTRSARSSSTRRST
jgi:hypothetical protein